MPPKKKTKTNEKGYLVKTVTDPITGKRKYFYGKTEKEIHRKMIEYSSEAQRGRTFATVSGEWWEEAYDKLAIQSRRTYNQARNRAEAEFGDTPIKDILPKDISRFLKRMAAQGFAMRTVSNQKMVINLVFQSAVLAGDIQYNPCASVDLPKDLPKKQRTAAKQSDEEIIKQTSDVWLFPYIAIMTGMRKGEILALQWKDIDFEENIISVTKSVCHDGDKPIIKSPKTAAGTRTVPLLAPLRERLLAVGGRKSNDYVISDDGKTPLTNKRYTTLMNHYQRDTGVSCTAHQLRHSFATIAFECGLQPKTVQEILGHRQLSTTMDLYTDFRKRAFDEAAALLNAELGKKQ